VGAFDFIYEPRWEHPLSDAIDNTQMVTFIDSGHLAHLEQAAEFATAITVRFSCLINCLTDALHPAGWQLYWTAARRLEGPGPLWMLVRSRWLPAHHYGDHGGGGCEVPALMSARFIPI
jgi:hypothetical protein